jgi:regulation of enolase protein 1 (concanavalin A-like superfamily)
MIGVCAVLGAARVSEAQSGALPAGWLSRDIGSSSGSSTADASGTFTVVGSGSNIWSSSDEFQFAYRAVTGDLDVRARLTAFDTVNDWSKAGVMVRDSLNGNARNAFMLFSPGTGLALQQRRSTGGSTSRSSGRSGGPPTWLRLVREGNRFTAYSSTNGTSWTTIASSTISMPAAVYVGLAISSRDANEQATGTFANVTVTAGEAAPPPPTTGWNNGDIGGPGRAGSATSSGGTFTVVGGGTNIWGSSDQFHYMYQQLSGDIEVIARVASLTKEASGYPKAGVMIRESLNANSKQGLMLASAGSGWAFHRRLLTGDRTDHTGGPSTNPPGWVRLVREGSLLSAFHSTNGTTWTLVDTDTIPMGTTVYAGLAVTSNNNSATSTAQFTNVTVRSLSPSANQPPTVALTSPTSGVSVAAPGSIYVAASASDPDGSIARVDLYRDTTLLKGDVTAPYSYRWSNVPAGTYSFRAIAFDNEGGSTTSATVTVTVTGTANQAPVVSLTSPSQGATYTAPASVSLSATASDADGTVARVDFFRGSTLIASDASSPYTTTWSNAAAGTYQLTAVARDDDGAVATSSAVTVTVNAAGNTAPSVTLTAPASGATFTAPANIAMQAAASDSDGTVARVEFYRGSTLISTDTSSPYTATWSSAPAGSYALTARAFDDDGASRTSTTVNITVTTASNQLPNVSITSPSAGASYAAPASVTITATASDPDGSIAGVDFFVGTQLIASDSSSPFSAAWSNVAAGTYSLTARARDNAGATRTSTAISVTVTPAGTPPTRVEFTPSTDHAANVASYVVAIYRSVDPITASPVATRDLGKPTPSGGVISVDISTLVNPLPTGSYYGVVRATNTSGSTASAPSAMFGM